MFFWTQNASESKGGLSGAQDNLTVDLHGDVVTCQNTSSTIGQGQADALIESGLVLINAAVFTDFQWGTFRTRGFSP
jgi:hypothetical protein